MLLYNPPAVPAFIASASLAALLAVLFARRRQSRYGTFAAMMICCLLYTLGYALQLSTPSFDHALLFYTVKQAGTAGIGPLFVLFAADQTGLRFTRKKLLHLLLWSIPLLSMAALLAWPHSRLFFDEAAMSSTAMPVFTTRPGPVYWIFQLHLGLCTGGGLAMLLRSILFTPSAIRRRLLVILCAAMVPFVMYLLHMGQRLAAGIDFTPVSFALTGLIMYYGIRRTHLFDMAPLIRAAIFEQMGDGAVVIDANGLLIDFNPAARQWLGDADKGTPVNTVPLLDGIALAGDTATCRYERTVFLNGSHFELDIAVSRLHESHPDNSSMILIIRDITGLRSKERELLEIIDNNPMSIQLIDRQGHHLRHNPAFQRLFGGPPPADISIFDLPAMIGSPEQSALLQKARRGETVLLPEFMFNPSLVDPSMPDKQLLLGVVIFPIIGNDGTPERYVLMHEDVTARRAAEQALHSSEELLRMAVAATDFDIWENNFVTGERKGTNRSLEAIGYTGDKTLDTLDKVFACIHPDDVSRLNTALNNHFTGKTALYQCEFRMHDPEGNWVWFENYGRVVEKDSEGHVPRFIGLTYNIDWRKKAEEQVSREREHL